jgi:hypothetical protein
MRFFKSLNRRLVILPERMEETTTKKIKRPEG